MNGFQVKKLLIATSNNLNNYEYFDCHKDYLIKDIPKILINKEKFLQKLQQKYGVDMGNYIIAKTYSDKDQFVDPTEIFKIMPDIKNK